MYDTRPSDVIGLSAMAQIAEAAFYGGRVPPSWHYAYGHGPYPQDPSFSRGPGYAPPRGAVIGGAVSTTAEEVLNRIAVLDSKVQGVDVDMHTNAAGTPLFGSWQKFKADWDAFRAKHRTTASILTPLKAAAIPILVFTLPGPDSVNQEVDGYESQLAGFQDALHRQFPGGSFQQQNVVPPPPPPKKGLPTWAIVSLTLAGVGLVGWGAYKAWSTFSPTARLLRAAHAQDLPGPGYVVAGDPDSPRGGASSGFRVIEFR